MPGIIKRDVLKAPILNYFDTRYEKNLLLSYITKPFRRGLDLSHTNMVEAMEIAKIFRDLNYNVDIADYDYEGYLNYHKYNFIFGFGEPFVRSFYGRKSEIISVYYATGMSISTQNSNGLRRVEDFFRRKKVYLPSSARLYEKAWTIQSTLPDAIITLGNETAKESFEKISNKKIFLLNPSFIKLYDYNDIIEARDYDDAKKNFLWFASSGMIHKGLDLLLDIFREFKNLHLHICGPVDDEPGFKEVYKNEFSLPNIHYYGFISVKEALFKELITKCASVVYPSSSEGGSPAVLNVCGNGGMVPIVSREATVDVNGYGYILRTNDINEIKDMIVMISESDNTALKEKGELGGKIISEKHTLKKFSDSLRGIIIDIINNNGSK